MEEKILNEIEREKAILLGVVFSNENVDINEDLEELSNLCEACGIETVEKVCQNLHEINPKTYIGSGKIEEIRMIKDSYDADLVVCNDELSPSQIENLENALKIKVIDRTYVILEIFKRRAKTKEALLQVEIASLKYFLPRLKGLREGLSRQGGGKNRGKGEKQIELDRRQIEKRITFLNNELKELVKNRQMQRDRRKKNNMKSVALVGYTNSGKSTTLNAILEKYSNTYQEDKLVFEKDMLFATLETSTRLIKLDNNLEFLLTDTVGFINKLPHSLVEAFKSTLEEIKEADLIVEVIDASSANYQMNIEVTNSVLKEIGADNIPILYAFNKIDKLDSYFFIDSIYENALRYSAKTKDSLDELCKKIEEMLFNGYHQVSLVFDYDESKLLSMVNENAKVLSIKYEDKIKVEALVSDYLYNYLNKHIVK